MHFKRLNALSVYLGTAFASALFFALITTVNLVYQATTVGLSPLQLVLVGTTLEVTAFICQVPTGILADLYSRRAAVILGTALTGLGFVIEGLFPTFGAVLLGQVVWGIGVTFVSGAQEAWISDEIGADRAGQSFVRGAQFGAVGGLVGIALSVALGSVQINVPIVVGGALYSLMGIALIFIMPETGFRPTPTEDRNSWQQMAHTLSLGRKLVQARPILLTIVVIGLFYGLYSEGYDRLWTDHILHNFTLPSFGNLPSLTWFGLLRAGALLIGIIANEIARRRVDTANPGATVRALLAISVVQVLSLIAFGLAWNFGAAVAMFWAFNTARDSSSPLFTAWINQHVESNVRATMHSFAGLIDAIGQIAGGPLIGGVAMALTGVIGLGGALRIALVTVGLLLSPVLILYGRTVRRT